MSPTDEFHRLRLGKGPFFFPAFAPEDFAMSEIFAVEWKLLIIDSYSFRLPGEERELTGSSEKSSSKVSTELISGAYNIPRNYFR